MSSNTNNPFYYATVFIKETKEIYTHGEFYDGSVVENVDNVYIFNPEGVASEEYAGLQDAVNNGKTVFIWAENAGVAPIVCTVVYGFYSPNAYFVSYAQAIVNGENSSATNYASMNVSQTAIESIGMISAPIISSLKTINGESIVGSGNITIEGGETLTEADILAMGFTKNAGTITGVSANGTSVATSGVANIPAASTSKYGVTKLSSATNSTSTTEAATPSAVKAAYDLANSKVSLLDGDIIYANGLKDESGEVYITPSAVEMGAEGTILATQSYVDNAVANAGSGGGSSYIPMPESFIEQGASVDHTLLPNSSVFALLSGSGAVRIYLQQPTSFDVVNEYTMIFRTFGFGNAITIDKTIIWANDNPPVLDDSVAEILEISVKCVNASMYDGIQYLGTWTKFSAS